LTDGKMNRQIVWWTNRHTHSQPARQRTVYAGMKADGQIERGTNRWTESVRERASDRKKD
jgi:hypothetical protein